MFLTQAWPASMSNTSICGLRVANPGRFFGRSRAYRYRCSPVVTAGVAGISPPVCCGIGPDEGVGVDTDVGAGGRTETCSGAAAQGTWPPAGFDQGTCPL